VTTASRRRPSLPELIEARADGIVLFGITPPKRSATPDAVAQIAAVTLQRLASLDLDGLILYDIDDESDRAVDERPFPYLPTMDPGAFRAGHLAAYRGPVIVYRCVGKYGEQELAEWLSSADTDQTLSVFVGASSSAKRVRTTLSRAQALRSLLRPELVLGAVVITERHAARGDEHLRMLAKQDSGCAFFVSQVVYDVDATKSVLSDYAYACRDRGVEPRPVVLTLSVCGSTRTLEFLNWLGVVVPRWLENDLRRSDDPLPVSYEQCLHSAQDLRAFARRVGVPIGFNVESVSIRRVEIDAAVALAGELRGLLDGGLSTDGSLPRRQ
jgi:hypothetical protein